MRCQVRGGPSTHQRGNIRTQFVQQHSCSRSTSSNKRTAVSNPSLDAAGYVRAMRVILAAFAPSRPIAELKKDEVRVGAHRRQIGGLCNRPLGVQHHEPHVLGDERAVVWVVAEPAGGGQHAE